MSEFLLNNGGTILIGLIVASCIISAVIYVIRSKRSGKCIGCGSGCAGCTKHEENMKDSSK